MAESTADLQFEDMVVSLCQARTNGCLSDDVIRGICAGLNDPLPDLSSTNDDVDIIKIELIIRLARAQGRGTLTPERMREIVARCTRVSERPVRVSMSPEIIVGEADPGDFDGIEGRASEHEELASEDDVMNVVDDEVATVEQETDTDPPSSADS